MTPLLLPVVAASLVGSAHCASMCGGLVAFSAGASDRRVVPHLAYHGARGTGYVVLGALAGALGRAIDGAGAHLGVGRAAAVLAGSLMLAWGTLRLLEAAGVSVRRVALPFGLGSHLAHAVRSVRDKPPAVRGALVGACTAALPCGWLHAFTVVAAGTGSSSGGAAVMAAFFLGTVPALVGLGVGVQAVTSRLRRHASIVGALALVSVGLASVLGRLQVPSALTSAGPIHGAAASVPTVPPCHVRH